MSKTPMLKITVEALVPVDAKDAIRQSVVTSAMTAAAEQFIQAANERDGHGTVSARIVRVEQPEAQLAVETEQP